MTDGNALLKAILAHPGDDTPRLVYADWLDEQRQHERAEFVRVLVANRGNPGAMLEVKGKRHAPARFQYLFDARPWMSGVAMDAVRRGCGYVQVTSTAAAVLWAGGFVEGVMLSGKSLYPVLPRLRATPLREVVLRREPTPRFFAEFDPDRRYWSMLPETVTSADRLLALLRAAIPNLPVASFDWHRPAKSFTPFYHLGTRAAA